MQLTQAQLDLLRQHVNAGDRLAYWATLESYVSTGQNTYAGLALDVVTNMPLSGASANAYFLHYAEAREGKTISPEQLALVGDGLMREDFRLRDVNGSDLTVGQIQDYHELVFNDVANVGPDAWTPNIYLNSFAPEDRQAVWNAIIADGAFSAVDIADRFTTVRFINVGLPIPTPIPNGAEELTYLWDLGQAGLDAVSANDPALGPYIVNSATGSVVGGTSGSDDVIGGSGNDVLIGSDGDDTLSGGAGSDRLHGGAGLDTATYAGEAFGIRVELGDLQDPASAALWSAFRGRVAQVEDGSGGRDTLLDIERLVGTDHDDIVVVTTELLPSLLGESVREGIDLSGEGAQGDTLDLSGVAGQGVTARLNSGTVSVGIQGTPAEVIVVDDVENVVGSAGIDTIDLSALRNGAQVDIFDEDVVVALPGNVAAASPQVTSVVGFENVIGSVGNDLVIGSREDNLLEGGAGLDTIDAAWGSDTVLGEQGDDIIDGGLGNDFIDGGSGHDIIFDGPSDDSVGTDYIIGGSGADAIYHYGGNDTIEGGEGSDIIFYSEGQAVLRGGKGNDYYDFVKATGTEATIVLEAGFGKDMFSSNSRAVDRVVFEGIASSDVSLSWDYSIQEIYSYGVTRQYLNGEAVINILSTGDSLYIGNVNGFMAFDSIGLSSSYIQSSFDLEFSDGSFFNWNSVFGRPDEISRTSIDPNSKTALDDFMSERENADPEDLIGGDGDDQLVGSQEGDTLVGNAGSDLLLGFSGFDLLRGGDGDDSLEGDEGDDTLEGGAGTDYLIGGDGNDEIRAANGASQAGFDTLIGGAGDDLLIGSNGRNLLEGGTGNDTLDGGNDWVTADKDTLLGGDGDDLLRSGQVEPVRAGAEDQGDYLFGEAGNDTLEGGLANDRLEGGEGTDLIFGGGGNDVLRAGALGDQSFGYDTLHGGDGDDLVEGSNASQELHGGAGNDTIEGGNDRDTADRDTMYGGDGDDLLISGQKVVRDGFEHRGDHLYGDAGNDTLESGLANDRLEGGTGADRFVFLDGFGADRIVDFDGTEGDLIDLSAVTGLDGIGEVVFTQSNGSTVLTFDLDGDGTVEAGLSITLDGQLVSAADQGFFVF
ncbi:MAG: calcium-binding protein [Parvularcula sp.]|jgi:Ca2+-binding RTX toxin-like protein|nr:calcium-binding protein [Parvularcula sp.]